MTRPEIACSGVPHIVLHLFCPTRTYWGHFRPSKVSFSAILVQNCQMYHIFLIIRGLPTRQRTTALYPNQIHFWNWRNLSATPSITNMANLVINLYFPNCISCVSLSAIPLLLKQALNHGFDFSGNNDLALPLLDLPFHIDNSWPWSIPQMIPNISEIVLFWSTDGANDYCKKQNVLI